MSNRIGNATVALFAALYVGAILTLDARGGLGLEDALMLGAIVGAGFSFLAWATTFGIEPAALPVPRPTLETILAILLVAGLGVYLVAGRPYLDQIVSPGSEPAHTFAVTAAKLLVFVAIPFVLYRAFFAHGWADFGLSRQSFARLLGRDGLAVVVIAVAICAFQLVMGNAAEPIRTGAISGPALWIGLALTFAWLVIEVGLVEEFFFRAVLQTRLAAFFKSEVAGLFVMALIFGLVHAPGMVLRGAGGVEGLGENPDALTAAAYTIVVQSVAGLYLGIVWMRTKNLPAVILIHAATDLFPNAAEFSHTIGLT